jgi:GNAT superfamily N-acetyltransferase
VLFRSVQGFGRWTFGQSMSNDPPMPAVSITICPFTSLLDRDHVTSAIEAIFFEASSVQVFGSAESKAAFLERWLTRYLQHFPREAFIARNTEGRVVGYLVGSLERPDQNAIFSDVTYFTTFADLLPAFPAHLHVNVAAGERGKGIGRQLIEAFAVHAAPSSVPGIHAVTGDGARNNGFYLGCGFHRAATSVWNGKALAFFARRLGRW